jgi:hypothetical protein
VALPQPTAPTMTTAAKASNARLPLTPIVVLRSTPFGCMCDPRPWQPLRVALGRDGRVFVTLLNPMYPPTDPCLNLSAQPVSRHNSPDRLHGAGPGAGTDIKQASRGGKTGRTAESGQSLVKKTHGSCRRFTEFRVGLLPRLRRSPVLVGLAIYLPDL